MRALNIIDGTITWGEGKLLRESIKDDIDYDAISVLNIGLTKRHAFDIFFLNIDEFDENEKMSVIIYENMAKEFVLKQKTMSDRIHKIKIVKETQDYREETLGDILDDE